MASRIPLPEEFTRRAFDRSSAHRAGLPPSRLRRADVERPFHGVQSVRTPRSVRDACRMYAVRLRPEQFFTHGTAAVLLGLPVPRAIEQDPAIHVGAVLPADAPHSRGVVGHRLVMAPPVADVDGLPVVDAIEAFCQLGASLDSEDLTVIADHLLNRSSIDEGTTRAALLDRVAAVRRVGNRRLTGAINHARVGSGSAAETRIRLVLESGRVPTAN